MTEVSYSDKQDFEQDLAEYGAEGLEEMLDDFFRVRYDRGWFAGGFLVTDNIANRKCASNLIGNVYNHHDFVGLLLKPVFGFEPELGERHQIANYGIYGMEAQLPCRKRRVFKEHKPEYKQLRAIQEAQRKNWIDAVIWASQIYRSCQRCHSHGWEVCESRSQQCVWCN